MTPLLLETSILLVPSLWKAMVQFRMQSVIYWSRMALTLLGFTSPSLTWIGQMSVGIGRPSPVEMANRGQGN